MAKRPVSNEYYDGNSSDDDELQIDLYTDMLERLTLGNSDSSDSDTAPPRKHYKCRAESDSDRSSAEESFRQHDSLSFNEEWEDVTESGAPPATIDFDLHGYTPGPQVPANVKEPIDYFKLYFTDELANSIVKETNDYVEEELRKKDVTRKSTLHRWYDVTKEEFLAFIGVVLNMGLIHLPKIQEYWSADDSSRIPFFPETFTRSRFMQIFWMLHLKKPVRGSEHARVHKVSDYLEYIDAKFRQYFIPYEAVTVDESIVKFKGRISFITCNPYRPTKWGIRVYALADSKTGYLFTILPYYGSETSDYISRPDLPMSTRIPLHLYRKLLERVPGARGYHMFTDKYYTSIRLAEELRKMNCHLTGAIKTTRKGIPEQIKEPRFSMNRTVAYRKDNITLLAWKDKKTHTMLTNYYNTQLRSSQRVLRRGDVVAVSKPDMVAEYTANLGGADRTDQYAATYCFLRKSLKWWRKLFFWGLEMCVINSYIVYRITAQANNERPMTHHKFVKTLVDQLRGDFRESRSRPSTSFADNRLDHRLHIPDVGQRKRDCTVCSDRKKPGGRRQTNYSCLTCTNQPAMHIGECFRLYHTVKKYKHPEEAEERPEPRREDEANTLGGRKPTRPERDRQKTSSSDRPLTMTWL